MMVRITGSGSSSGIYRSTTTAKKSSKTGKKTGGGSVHVSDAVSLREKAAVMLADMPDVRMERIEEVRDALESGEYHVEAEHVASRIVSNALAERPW